MKQEYEWIYKNIERLEYDIEMYESMIKDYAKTIGERAEQGEFQSVMELAQRARDCQQEIDKAENRIKDAKRTLRKLGEENK